jgi:hypothetical protein
LGKLGEDFLRNGHTHLKVYPQDDPSKSFKAVRLFLENLRSVSGAKIRLEKLLAGVVVLKGQVALWDAYFLKSAALVDLQQLGETYNLYICRDTRKAKLLMYGASAHAQHEVQQALIEKVEALHQFENKIILTPQLLKQAIDGGMRRLKVKFGEAVGSIYHSTQRQSQLSAPKTTSARPRLYLRIFPKIRHCQIRTPVTAIFAGRKQ